MKKFLIVILTVLMLVSAFPTLALAADGDVFVFDEFKDYVIQSTYLADDGIIGIPVEVVTYCKDTHTNEETNVILYVMGANIAGFEKIAETMMAHGIV